MPNLYQTESYDVKINAQRNLQGRTHYVDDDTLKYHKSRVMSCHVVDGGLLLALVMSDALDYNNTKRGFRFVVFDVFGNVVERQTFDEAFKTSKAAKAAMWEYLNTVNAVKITREAMKSHAKQVKREHARLREDMKRIKAEGKI